MTPLTLRRQEVAEVSLDTSHNAEVLRSDQSPHDTPQSTDAKYVDPESAAAGRSGSEVVQPEPLWVRRDLLQVAPQRPEADHAEGLLLDPIFGGRAEDEHQVSKVAAAKFGHEPDRVSNTVRVSLIVSCLDIEERIHLRPSTQRVHIWLRPEGKDQAAGRAGLLQNPRGHVIRSLARRQLFA